MEPEARDEMLEGFGAALGRGLGDPVANLAAYFGLRAQYEPLVRRQFEDAGLRLPWAYWQAFWREVFPVAPPTRDPQGFMDLLYGLSTRCDEELRRHVRERHEDGGNNVWEVFGLSGTGKSSGIMGLVHELAPFKAGMLPVRVVFDQSEVARAMAQIAPTEWVVLDEQTRLAGQGSKTLQEELLNLEEQGRASQKNIVFLSPMEREGESQRISLRSIAWSRTQGKTAFLVRCMGSWLGYAVLPFCPAEVWAEYSPLKARQVQRAVAGNLRNKVRDTLLANEAAFDPEFEMCLLGRGKPKASDFKMAVFAALPRLADSKTEQEVAKRAEFLARNWERQKVGFRERFGVEPAPVWEKFKHVFYKERGG